MRTGHRICIVICVALVAVVQGEQRIVSAQSAQAAALKIVVLEGEGAVNIIPQKTAVAPIVEVRDRNDQPVSGAIVRFAIQKGRASFNGARTLSVTTDAAGRATATGLTATGSGTLQIGTTATFQGQTAAVTIAQTNVLTAAQAAAAAAGGKPERPAEAADCRTSRSPAAPALESRARCLRLRKSSGTSNTTSDGPSSSVTSRTFVGPFNGDVATTTATTTQSGTSTCVSTRSISGTMTIQLDQRADAAITGSGSTSGTQTETAVTGSPLCSAGVGSIPFNWGGPLTGAGGNVMFDQQTTSTSTSPATVTVTNNFAFTGTLSNGVIAGTVRFSSASNGQQNPPLNGTITGSGSTTFAVTLR